MIKNDSIIIRSTQHVDLPGIVALLADDPIGNSRETPLSMEAYHHAHAKMIQDPAIRLFVAVDITGAVIGYVQMTMTQHLSYRGARRALLEDLRVAISHRSLGIGRRLVSAAIYDAKNAGCRLVQLFVHQSRDRARCFYRKLGFQADHLGLRLVID
jgi:ribosomal protein S18 acetylase RimI-like enzyme